MHVKKSDRAKNLIFFLMVVISSNWLALKSKGSADTLRESKKRELQSLVTEQASQRSKKRKHDHLIAIDCEMVEGESVEHMLARVSLVDYDGRILYDAYVKPREDVIDYRTAITGLTKDILRRKGEDFDKVRSKVVALLKEKVVVGHAVHHDFEALDLVQPARGIIRDTCTYSELRPPNRKQTPSLKLLAEYWLDKHVQGGSHSSVEDARIAMMLYKRFEESWEASLVE